MLPAGLPGRGRAPAGWRVGRRTQGRGTQERAAHSEGTASSTETEQNTLKRRETIQLWNDDAAFEDTTPARAHSKLVFSLSLIKTCRLVSPWVTVCVVLSAEKKTYVVHSQRTVLHVALQVDHGVWDPNQRHAVHLSCGYKGTPYTKTVNEPECDPAEPFNAVPDCRII